LLTSHSDSCCSVLIIWVRISSMENTKWSTHIYEQYIYRYSTKMIKSTCRRPCRGEYSSTIRIPRNKGIKSLNTILDKQVE
jgi:uncharacterized Fe-S radical SAM superfamily protein PflX